jgi:NAD+ synthase (glutamine-hydrolysing)
MKVLAAQMNPVVGDIIGNTSKILHLMGKARVQGAEIVVFPELAMCGYPALDLLLFPSFIEQIENYLAKIIEKSSGLMVVVGLPRKTGKKEGKPLHNSVAIIADGKLLGFKDKTLLPDYDVFNELRYFEPGGESQRCWLYKGKKVGVLICEDGWQLSADVTGVRYATDPVLELAKASPDLCLIPAASPYYYRKNELRKKIYSRVAKRLDCPLILCSQVGANDQLVFDGYSTFFGKDGEVKQKAKGFVEEDFLVDLDSETEVEEKEEAVGDLYSALVLGVRDYFSKQGFSKACLGLSGGVDSALTACIAADALGAHNVKALRMPSRFSSLAGIEDSEILTSNLRIDLIDIPIDNLFQHFLDQLSPIFCGKPFDTAEENIQARIRGMLLMAFSNKLGYIVLSTGNKSEMAMGYVTLYGDMCGGLSVLSDVSKTMVYTLSKWINRKREIIPKNIIEKAPSAELKKDQKDSDSLPPYEIVDLVLEQYVENHKSIDQIIKEHRLSKELVRNLVDRIHLAEYKRRQGPLGIIVTKKAFGVGRIFPIVQRWV